MSFLEMVRAYRMALAQLATELAIALIVIAILVGGIAANIFFSINATQLATWDPTSRIVWPYIFPLCLAALLVAILYHMYTGTRRD
jgi:succinate dehydrogenase/fumarate reductase cytochrome b subunit